MTKSILIILTLAGFASGAEMEVTDRLAVDGSSIFKSTAVFSGSVGIGTTVPGVPLEIKNGGNDLLLLNRSGVGTWYFGQYYDKLALAPSAIGTGGGTNIVFLIDTAGNVGIGTTSPSLARLVLGTDGSGTSGSAMDVQFGGQGAFGLRSYNDGSLNYIFLDRNYGGWQSIPAMTWTAPGNVGIGTTNPVNKLELVDGSASYQPSVVLKNINEGGYAPAIYFNAYGYSGSPAGQFDILKIETGYAGASGGYAAFYTKSQPQSSAATALVLKGNGNVGIGTTNPTALMDINSTTNHAGAIHLKDTGSYGLKVWSENGGCSNSGTSLGCNNSVCLCILNQ